jgi:Ni,Fe-hydrogenase I large subunit
VRKSSAPPETGSTSANPTCVVGGMATLLDKTHPKAVNQATIAALKNLAAQALTFITQVYLPDLLLLASFYKEWADAG